MSEILDTIRSRVEKSIHTQGELAVRFLDSYIVSNAAPWRNDSHAYLDHHRGQLAIWSQEHHMTIGSVSWWYRIRNSSNVWDIYKEGVVAEELANLYSSEPIENRTTRALEAIADVLSFMHPGLCLGWSEYRIKKFDEDLNKSAHLIPFQISPSWLKPIVAGTEKMQANGAVLRYAQLLDKFGEDYNIGGFGLAWKRSIPEVIQNLGAIAIGLCHQILTRT